MRGSEAADVKQTRLGGVSLRVFVTYLEQTEPPAGNALAAPLAGLRIAPERLAVDDYLRLYRAVGGPYLWTERLRLSREALAALLRQPTSLLFVLRHDTQPVGLCEFNDVATANVELKYFGLVQTAQGQGVGPYVLDHCLREIWQRGPNRVWLHTDTNDHPKAKPTYERSGFRVYAERWETFAD